MKKIIGCLLVLALCAALMSNALAASGAKPVTVDYADLTKLIISGNTAYQKDLQDIQKLEYNYDELSQQQWDIYMDMSALPDTQETEATRKKLEDSADTIGANMRMIRNRINDQKKALNDRATIHAYPAQKMYVSYYILLQDLEIASLELERLDRELASCRLKLSRGLSTPTEVRNAEKSLDNQKDVIEACSDSIDDNLKALARYIGLTSPIVLTELPDVDFERITGRDLKADMYAYIQASSATAEKIWQSARDSFELNNTTLNRYARDIALSDYEKAKKDAEADFPKVYEDLRKAYDDFIDSTAVADAQEDYDTALSQYERGLISLLALNGAEQKLDTIVARYEQQRLQLRLLFMEYEYNLLKP